jgi:hypothetical protein
MWGPIVVMGPSGRPRGEDAGSGGEDEGEAEPHLGQTELLGGHGRPAHPPGVDEGQHADADGSGEQLAVDGDGDGGNEYGRHLGEVAAVDVARTAAQADDLDAAKGIEPAARLPPR